MAIRTLLDDFDFQIKENKEALLEAWALLESEEIRILQHRFGHLVDCKLPRKTVQEVARHLKMSHDDVVSPEGKLMSMLDEKIARF